jgi:hypothetical protein
VEGVAAPVGQAQSSMQECCYVAEASSSCVKAQDACDKLNCVDGSGSPGGACLQLLPLGRIPAKDLLVVLVYSCSLWDEFRVNNSG